MERNYFSIFCDFLLQKKKKSVIVRSFLPFANQCYVIDLEKNEKYSLIYWVKTNNNLEIASPKYTIIQIGHLQDCLFNVETATAIFLLL